MYTNYGLGLQLGETKGYTAWEKSTPLNTLGDIGGES